MGLENSYKRSSVALLYTPYAMLIVVFGVLFNSKEGVWRKSREPFCAISGSSKQEGRPILE